MQDDNPAEASVPRAVFSVNDIPARERYEVWKESISCIFDVDADVETRREDFFAAVDASMFGPIMLARSTSRGQRWRRSSSTIARDGMDHYMIQLYETGGQTLNAGRIEVEQPVGGLLVYDLSRTVAARSGTFTNLSLIIPRGLLAEALVAPDDRHMQTLPATGPMVAMLRDHMLSLTRLSPRMTAAQAAALVPATVALTAACLNTSGPDGPATGNGVAFVSMLAARRLIDSRLSDENLTPDWLARRLGMSRAKLYRMFEPVGGIAQYIRDRRLRRAMLELRDEPTRHLPIYEIALRAGFSSETTFGRAFRQRYGVTPRDVRYRGAPARHGASDDGPDRRYEEWLHHLAV
ncbi:MAG: helix-turn-helix domain-containing protein [Thalassobaculum sp.]|uniref:helix-turn-helix domain-containing protein n=1 Tax=Thalassobaculum sp. TaxID=2022740 RepID=UPI0032EB9148